MNKYIQSSSLNNEDKKKESLSSNIEKRIRKMILIDKIYSPNQQLPNEQTLAKQMGVSRTTIREVIKSLVASGVVEIVRGVGTFVSEHPGISPDPFGLELESNKMKVLLDWYSFRLILETEAMELVVKNASDEEIDEIKWVMLTQNQISQNSIEYTRLDQKFHTLLALATHNTIMEKMIPSLYQSFYYDSVYYDLLESNYTTLSDNFKNDTFEAHQKIVKFLEIRDAKGANLAMRYHIQNKIDNMNYYIFKQKQ